MKSCPDLVDENWLSQLLYHYSGGTSFPLVFLCVHISNECV